MKLLVSPKNIQEARVTINAGVDYIDCKNPKEGSLGANFPWIIQEMKSIIPGDSKQVLSATIGDFPNLPGTASLAALGAALSGADIIKVGLKGPKTKEQGIFLMKNVIKAVKNYNNKIRTVTAGYADYKRLNNALDFLSIPDIAAESGSDIAMLDTYIKDGKNLFYFLNIDQLLKFIKKANEYNLKTALAGNLKKEDFSKIKKLSPDIIGVRSAVCEGFDRNNGTIKYDSIIELRRELNR
ncbi:MAG: (5-formylfuran-3-yl)methyl phosphate synthase [Candidatus Lokiarchaeota archaeon]|nr:(5-formylfuran-3-yl)methyl phosphate synthase [Candidatus Lokiarchaeota archaeon]